MHGTESSQEGASTIERADYLNKLTQDLHRLGLEKGDAVLVRSAARAVGVPKEVGRSAEVLNAAIANAIGESGTVVMLSFTPPSPFWKKGKTQAFDRHTPTTSGGASQQWVDNDAAFRSDHPTNSIIAYGPAAEEIARAHGPEDAPFASLKKLIELGGKVVLVGCVKASPGFSTVHLAQEALGIDSQSPISGLLGRDYINANGAKVWHSRKSVPGCSNGFYKHYAHYAREGVLRTAWVGEAYSILAPAREAFEIDLAALREDGRSALCDDPGCISCGTRFYNWRAWPRFGCTIGWRALTGKSIGVAERLQSEERARRR